jgi:hypothetical protein
MVESMALYKVTVAYSTGVLDASSMTLPLMIPETKGYSANVAIYGCAWRQIKSVDNKYRNTIFFISKKFLQSNILVGSKKNFIDE